MSNLTDILRAAAKSFRDDIDHWNDEIAGLERDIVIRRERISAAELDAVERMVAANILDEMDLTVDRVDGVPHVSVARTTATASCTCWMKTSAPAVVICPIHDVQTT